MSKFSDAVDGRNEAQRRSYLKAQRLALAEAIRRELISQEIISGSRDTYRMAFRGCIVLGSEAHFVTDIGQFPQIRNIAVTIPDADYNDVSRETSEDGGK